MKIVHASTDQHAQMRKRTNEGIARLCNGERYRCDLNHCPYNEIS